MSAGRVGCWRFGTDEFECFDGIHDTSFFGNKPSKLKDSGEAHPRDPPFFGQQNWMEIARLDPHVREPPGRSPMGLVNRSGEEAPDEENGFVDIFNKVLGCRNQRTFGGIDVSANQ